MSSKLKGYLAGAGAIVLAIIAALILYGTAQKRAYLEAKGQAAVLAKQYADYKVSADAQIAGLTVQYTSIEAERDKALAAAAAAQAAQVQALADLATLQSLTAALPPDSLSGAINTRIGANQSWPTAGGVFTFTRPGAEGVLNRFLQGEADANLYRAERTVSVNLRAAIDAAERENGNLGLRLTLTAGERDKAIAAWGATSDALKHLERAQFGLGLKHYAIGAGVGAATIIVLRILKVL